MSYALLILHLEEKLSPINIALGRPGSELLLVLKKSAFTSSEVITHNKTLSSLFPITNLIKIRQDKCNHPFPTNHQCKLQTGSLLPWQNSIDRYPKATSYDMLGEQHRYSNK